MSRGILSILLVSLLASAGLFGQAVIDNGEIRVALENYGEIEVFSPATATDTVFQIDRMSLLTGVSVDAVFDYFEDADNVSAPEAVLQPMLSDFELRGTFDNFFSQEPPAVVEKVNIYGWNSGAFVVMKIVVRNAETAAIDAIHGFEVLPQVDGAYGDETVEYLPAEGVVAMYKAGATHTGYKIFNHAINSINTFEWFSGFGGSDTLLYNFTVEDPTAWSRPWSAEIPMRLSEAPMFEYACHEGNYGMTNLLAGARVEEQAAAAAAKTGSK